MPIAAIISIGLSGVLFLVSLLFKVAGKLRLGIPLLYFLVVGFFPPANRWASANETLAFTILYALVGLAVLSWIVSLVRKIREKRAESFLEDDVAWQINKAREMGIPLDNIRFDENGSLIDPRTGEPIIYGNTQFRKL